MTIPIPWIPVKDVVFKRFFVVPVSVSRNFNQLSRFSEFGKSPFQATYYRLMALNVNLKNFVVFVAFFPGRFIRNGVLVAKCRAVITIAIVHISPRNPVTKKRIQQHQIKLGRASIPCPHFAQATCVQRLPTLSDLAINRAALRSCSARQATPPAPSRLAAGNHPPAKPGAFML